MPKQLIVKGHTLRFEGRMPYGASTVGSSYCSCGEKSPVLPSARARQRWHREHKGRVLAELVRGGKRTIDGARDDLGLPPLDIEGVTDVPRKATPDGFSVADITGPLVEPKAQHIVTEQPTARRRLFHRLHGRKKR